ncbi:MAG: ferrous iron transport protein B [Opitutales bacterium]|nr:ferrous iron transport protein B [Opitutales bacterium]
MKISNLKIAIAGNPNCGKTTLFNSLTNLRAHVGNWPGVTVEKKEGKIDFMGKTVEVADLPGVYSLSPYSPEEKIARDYILDGGADVIINIVDASNIERNLYLTTQILETSAPVVVALNMTDIARKNNIRLDTSALSKRLGAPVVEICALKNEGLKDLLKACLKAAESPREPFDAFAGSSLEEPVKKIAEIAAAAGKKNPKMLAACAVESGAENSGFSKSEAEQIEKILSETPPHPVLGADFEAIIADTRFNKIGGVLSGILKKPAMSEKLTASDKADRILTGKILGLPIFLAIRAVVFNLTFGEDLLFLQSIAGLFGVEIGAVESPGVMLQGWAESLIEWISSGAAAGLESAGASGWVRGLVVDGVLAGVGAVLSFVPQILMLFLFLSIMEDTGYMARAAFLTDKFLRKFGLSGKAFMPMIMCFGCSVPAMMGARTLENPKERRLMIMLAPFFSCGAKLPIWAIFAAAIFPKNADLAIFAIYLSGIIVAFIASLILKNTILKGEPSPFILELPPYRIPTLKNVLANLWEKLKHYITKAATIIAGATVVIWFLSSFDFSLGMVETSSKESILGSIGSFIAPIFAPLGWGGGDLGWKAVTAAITGLIAKEMVVSTMGVLYNPGVEGDALEDEAAGTALGLAISATFSPLAAVSYMLFNLLSVPCMAAVATAHAEFGSTKQTWITIAFWLSTAWIVSFLVYNVGSIFF